MQSSCATDSLEFSSIRLSGCNDGTCRSSSAMVSMSECVDVAGWQQPESTSCIDKTASSAGSREPTNRGLLGQNANHNPGRDNLLRGRIAPQCIACEISKRGTFSHLASLHVQSRRTSRMWLHVLKKRRISETCNPGRADGTILAAARGVRAGAGRLWNAKWKLCWPSFETPLCPVQPSSWLRQGRVHVLNAPLGSHSDLLYSDVGL